MVESSDMLAVARRCRLDALRGSFAGFGDVVEILRADPSDEAQAWMLALQVIRWFVDPTPRLPSCSDLARFTESSPVAREAAAIACAHMERAALLRGDGPALQKWLQLHDRLDADHAWLHAGKIWRSVMSGSVDGLDDACSALGSQALSDRDAALVIEAATLRAMVALVDRRLEEATTLSRRASRMSRTESIPQQEYLANIVLARVRRITGKPHLATRILSSLLRVANQPWRPWMLFELILAQGAESTPLMEAQECPMMGAARELRSVLEAASSGRQADFCASARRLERHTEGFGELRLDVSNLICGLHPHGVQATSAAWLAWSGGASREIPEGLHGVCGAMGQDSPDKEAAYVLAPGNRDAMRILAPGLGLALSDGAHRLEAGKGRQARTESTLAALALAGPDGMEEGSLFRLVYGFEYDAGLHQGVRNVLYHRARARLGGLGDLVREAGRIRLEQSAAILIPDPRCSPPPEHNMLRVLAKWGQASAKEAAQALGIPVRTAQEALRRLAEDGACRVEKQGRKLQYHLEDTTFSEPTRH